MSYIQCTPYFRTDISGWLLHLLMIILSIFEQIPSPPPPPRPALPSPFQTLHQVFHFVKVACLEKHNFLWGMRQVMGRFVAFF